MSDALKCPECGGKVTPRQERCDHCGVWFKNSTPATFSGIMADNDRGDKPMETIVYYGHAHVTGKSGVGVSASGNAVLSPSTSGGVRRVAKKITGTVVEETSEHVIVMTRKDQLVKIRPENIIRRGVASRPDRQKEAQAALALIVGIFIVMIGALIFILGSVWLWALLVAIGGLMSVYGMWRLTGGAGRSDLR